MSRSAYILPCVLLVALAGTAACSLLTGDADEGVLTVVNRADRPLAAAAIAQEHLNVLDLAPGLPAASFAAHRIQPGSAANVDIQGYAPSQRVFVILYARVQPPDSQTTVILGPDAVPIADSFFLTPDELHLRRFCLVIQTFEDKPSIARTLRECKLL